MPVLGATRRGSRRFLPLQREIIGSGPKMLAHTLPELEQHSLVFRTVHNARPVALDYALTDYGRSAEGVLKG